MGLHPPERVAEWKALGAWTDDTIDGLFRQRVAAEPDRVALVDPLNRADLVDGPERSLTWTEIDAEVDRIAAILLAHGVTAGTPVGMQLPNTVEIALVFLAVVRLGGIVVPFPVQYRAHELTELSRTAAVQVFVTASRIGKRPAAAEMAELAPHIPSLRAVVAAGDVLPDGVLSLGSSVGPGDQAALASYLSSYRSAADPNECVTICWTSGTESTPKGVQRTHYDWLAMSWTTIEGPGLTADDVLLNPFPMVNMAGINGMFLPWLRVGGVLVQHHPFDLATFLRQIELHRATYTVAPPALLTQLLHHPEMLASTDISSLRLMGSGSTPLAPSLLTGWRDTYGIEILNFYGSNEGIALFGGPADIPDPAERALYFPRYGAPGKTWSFKTSTWTKVKLVADDGSEITEPGVPGELRIKGPGTFPGYLPASNVPQPFDADGYLITGDVLEIAGANAEYLHYVDRAKDLVIRGGMKISAAEVESLIAGNPKVADVAVIGVPDDVLGERTCAVVVPRDGQTVTLDDVVGPLREIGIATFKLPERLLVVDELPRNPVGKVLKRELRDRFATVGAAAG